jgi:hypothetical protein
MLCYNKRFKQIMGILIQEDITKIKVERIISLLANELDIYRIHTINGKVLNKEEYKLFILSKIHKLIPLKNMTLLEYAKKISRE